VSTSVLTQSETAEDAIFTASEPEEILDALVELEVIEGQGLELYHDEALNLTDSGIDIILGTQAGDVVYGGEITLDLDNENAQCFLLGFAQFSPFGSGLTGGIVTAIFPTESGSFRVGFADYGGQNGTAVDTFISLSDTVQIVVVILDNIATVYIDGAPTITDFEVSLSDGGFGVGMETQNDVSNTSCTISKMFANVLNVDSVEFAYTEVIDMPAELAFYNSSSENILGELQAADAIPVEGELQALEDAYLQTNLPVDYVNINEDYEDNFVWGGTLTFNPSGNTDTVQLCELVIDSTLYTVERNGNEVTYDDGGFAVTFYNNGNIAYGGGIFAGEYQPSQATRFVLVVLDDHVTIYINGERRTQHFLFGDRGESLAFGIRFPSAGTNCQLSNTWVYDLSASELVYASEQPCTVSVSAAVNQRSEPSTSASIVGQLQPGNDVSVIAQTTDTSGFVWWRLEDESWVREDVVNSNGGCASIPTSE
jgi:hypothetical protein